MGTSTKSVGITVLIVLAEIVVGFIIGIIAGLLGWFFKYIKNDKLRMWVKFFYCIAVIIAFPVVADSQKYPEAKFIGSLLFGYTCFCVWGPEKPS